MRLADRQTTMIRRALLVLALTTAAMVGPMATARACSCMTPDAAAFLADSDFVFAGALVEDPGRNMQQMSDIAYTFEVDAVYKGDIRDSTVEVWSAPNGAACGFEMAPGQPVAIAASFFEGRLSGGLCATFGVDQLEAAAADVGIQPVIPTETPDEAIDEPAVDAAIPVATIAAGAAVAGVVLTMAIARRTRRDGA